MPWERYVMIVLFLILGLTVLLKLVNYIRKKRSASTNTPLPFVVTHNVAPKPQENPVGHNPEVHGKFHPSVAICITQILCRFKELI